MQIASDKHCFLKDLDDVPASELSLWIAFYKLEEEKAKRKTIRGAEP